MIYIIVGTDAGARSNKRRSLVQDVHVEELDWGNISTEELTSIAETSSLLGDTGAYLLVQSLTDPERDEEFLSILEVLKASAQTFIFEEEKLLKKQTDVLKKANIIPDILRSEKKEESFNVFSLANALAARNKKQFWILLIKAFHRDVAAENIVGVLHWKVRDMLSKNNSQKYTKEELRALSRELLVMYHESHRGHGDLSLLLERFGLSLE